MYHLEVHTLVAYLSDREAATLKQKQVNKEERFNSGIEVTHPIKPSDSSETDPDGRREGEICSLLVALGQV